MPWWPDWVAKPDLRGTLEALRRASCSEKPKAKAGSATKSAKRVSGVKASSSASAAHATPVPAAASVDLEHACGVCGATDGDLKRCSGCKGIWYCSREHQKADWKRHKRECSTPPA